MTDAVRNQMSLRRHRLRHVLVALYIAVNLAIIPATIPFGPHRADWQTFIALREAVGTADIYALETLIPFVWSPAAAWLMAAITYVGYWPWVAVHVGVLALLRFSPTLLLLVGTSWAFWIDVAQGNILTLVVIAGILAIRGDRRASLLSVALLLLMPRPAQLPLVAYLLWQQPGIRWGALGIFVAHTSYVLATGLALPWIDEVADWSRQAVGIGPTRFIGLAWLWIGIPLGVWLTWRGRVGWAGLAVSSYVLPQYLLLPLIDLARSRWIDRVPRKSGRSRAGLHYFRAR